MSNTSNDQPNVNSLAEVHKFSMERELSIEVSADERDEAYDAAYEMGVRDGNRGYFNRDFAANAGYIDGQVDVAPVDSYL